MNAYTAREAGLRAWIGETLLPSTLALISNMLRNPRRKGAQDKLRDGGTVCAMNR